MLEQAQVATTVIFSTRGGEFAEVIANAGSGTGASAPGAIQGANAAGGGRAEESRVGSLDDLDGIVVVGGDGTFFEVVELHLCHQEIF